MNVAIIGGGAAGFFAAITLKEQNKDIHVTIFEKTSNVLSKLAISGGGRCNLTNTFEEIQDLKKAYPRGDKLLKKAFRTFSHLDTVTWFQKRGVPLVTQEDQCVFPRSQNAQSIIDCFLHLSATLGVNIKRSYGLKFLQSKSNQIELHFLDEKQAPLWFDKVIVTTGGSPHREGLSYLEALGHKIEEPVPSLFTFNIPNDSIRELMGVVVENTIVSLQGTKLKTTGALLITHWGMSGPA
ncbi:MAG: aminoacetone oxidase family FAD-binding enzyme, partial [Bacteroidaceae bacterium]